MSETRFANRFPGPFEVETPAGAEGWQALYPYYYTFSPDRQDYEQAAFWYQDALHHPAPMCPFDTIVPESWWVGLGQNNSRIFMVPPALGIDQRVLNGYLYITPIPVEPDKIGPRVEWFMKRAGYYFQNWDRLYGQWKEKATACIRDLENLQVPDLPEMEDEAVVFEARGVSTGYNLLSAYDKLIDSMYKIWQLHFEFLNLGYAAYLTYGEFCRKAFPGISDQNIARMVSGIDVILYKPDDLLKELAVKAVALDVADAFASGSGEEILGRLAQMKNGAQWIAEFEKIKHPWFYFSLGTGMAHHYRSWIDDLSVPFSLINSYAQRAARGESLARPTAELVAQRDILAGEYAALLQTEEDKKAFADLVGLARTVFPYVEEHNFYVEHWHHTVFWNKAREFGQVLVKAGFFAEADDIFYLHRFDVHDALYDLVGAWASGGITRGPKYWPGEVARRKQIMAALARWSPPPALGAPPEVINEPFTVMLWGITTERVKDWLSPRGDNSELRGFAGSPGTREGIARRVMTVEELNTIEDGEILICPITTPSWAPVFGKIQAVVTDIGGIMSHAAIVCREYGVPAVVGTGYGTKTIKTGQRVRVDGSTGVVTILS